MNENETPEWDAAEAAIVDLCEKVGEDFAYVSDTGTVENLREAGFSLDQIARGDVHRYAILANLFMLD